MFLKLCSTLSWNSSNSALNILCTSLVKACIMNFMSTPPATPSDAIFFLHSAAKTRLEKKSMTSQITRSRVFTRRMIHSICLCFHIIYLAFSHSNYLTTLSFFPLRISLLVLLELIKQVRFFRKIQSKTYQRIGWWH